MGDLIVDAGWRGFLDSGRVSDRGRSLRRTNGGISRKVLHLRARADNDAVIAVADGSSHSGALGRPIRVLNRGGHGSGGFGRESELAAIDPQFELAGGNVDLDFGSGKRDFDHQIIVSDQAAGRRGNRVDQVFGSQGEARVQIHRFLVLSAEERCRRRYDKDARDAHKPHYRPAGFAGRSG